MAREERRFACCAANVVAKANDFRARSAANERCARARGARLRWLPGKNPALQVAGRLHSATLRLFRRSATDHADAVSHSIASGAEEEASGSC